MSPRPAPPSDNDWAGHHSGSRDYRRVLVSLLAAGIATFAQLYSPQGILPIIAAQFDVSAALAGLMISAATLGMMVAVLPWSWLADRVGRVRAMKLSLIAAAAFALLSTVSPSFELLLAVRFFEGAALAGLPAIAMAYLHEEVSPRFTAVAAGTYISGTTIGGLLGRMLTVPVAEAFHWRIGIAAVAAISIVASIVFILLVPPPRGFVRQRATPIWRAVIGHLRRPILVTLFAQGFLLMGGFISIYNYLGFRLEAPPFLLPPVLASLLFLSYLTGTLSSARVGRAVQKFGRRMTLLSSIVLMIAGVGLTTAESIPVIVGGLLLLTAGFFAAHSVASEWVGREATGNRAQASSLYNLFYYAGSSVFGWLSGLAFVAGGWGATAGSVIALCVVAGAISLTLPGRSESLQASHHR
jgi:YNFM family putative membrane transporter